MGQFRQRLQDKGREWREIQLARPGHAIVPCKVFLNQLDHFLTVGVAQCSVLSIQYVDPGVTTGRGGLHSAALTVLERRVSMSCLLSRQDGLHGTGRPELSLDQRD